MSVVEAPLSPVENLLDLASEAQRQSDMSAAAELYEALLHYSPEQPEALHFLGKADFQQGRIGQGCARLESAVRQRPDAPDFLDDLGAVYLALGRVTDALRVYTRAVELAPQNSDFLCNLAHALLQAGQNEAAAAIARKLLAHAPDHPSALSVAGQAARRLGNVEQARQYFAKLVQVTPQAAQAHCNLGAALMQLHQIAQAAQSYRRAIELAPVLAEAHYRYALCCFLQGNLPEGSAHYEWRLQLDEAAPANPRSMDMPQWDGSPQPDKTILLHSEQGLGDMLQFVRFAPAVAAMVGKVVVEVQKPIRQILQDAFPAIQFVGQGDALPPVDLHSPLMSLLHKLQVQLGDLPACATPYLKARPELVEKWKLRLGSKPGRKIAIVWQGNPHASADEGRSLPLAALAPLLQISGLRFISLQKNAGTEQLAALPPALRARIEVLGEDFDNGPDAFLDTLAVIRNCDLVLTTDTAIAHVAGAAGAPTWLMLGKTPDWRWMLDRTDSPWYPGLRLIRQRESGNWGEVIAAIASELAPPDEDLTAALRLHRRGELTAAEDLYKKIIHERRDEHVARHHLGVIALQRGQADVAETYIREALALRPNEADALANLAQALKAQQRLEEAAAVCQQALVLAPQHSGACHNLAGIYYEQGRLDEAVAAYRQAIALDPGRSQFIHDLGLALLENGQLAEAEAALRQALRQSPDNAGYHFDLARCLLMQGQWSEGWQEYEYRRQIGEFGAVSEPTAPRWKGESDSKLVLLVHAEQGFGDAIQFARYIKLARARVGRLMLVVPVQLKMLLGQVEGVDEIYGQGEPVPACHVHVPLLSLPAVLGLGVLPAGVYLQPQAAQLQRWREWRAACKGKLIGLSWQGNAKARADAGRSLHVTQLAALAGVAGVTFVALQKGAALDQLSELPPDFPLVVPPAPFDEGPAAFSDSAALLSVCDALISTDTSLVHLAGALGVPTFVLLKQCPDWRWQMSGTSSDWYASLRLLRQSASGSWQAVVDALVQTLAHPLPQRLSLPTLEQALAAHQAGQTAQAIAAYQSLLRIKPDNWRALHFSGLAHHQSGHAVMAEQLIRQALAHKPDYAEAWSSLALVLEARQKPEAAEAAFRHALTLGPDLADIHNSYGGFLQAQKRVPEAIAQYEQAIALQPNRAEGYHHMAQALSSLEQHDKAIAGYQRALALRPRHVATLGGLGHALRLTGQAESAIAVFKEALEVDGGNSDCWNSLGLCYDELAQHEQAIACYDKALQHGPASADCWGHKAGALHCLARFTEAEEAYARALQLAPDRAELHVGLAALLLAQGRWAEGWKEYEWRRFLKGAGPVRSFPRTLWNGSAQSGSSLLLFAEPGLSDTLQSLRLLPLVREKFSRVILEVQPALYRLVKEAVGDVVLVRQGEALPAFDAYAPLPSMPALLGLTVETLPAPQSSLHAEPQLIAKWKTRLPQGKLLVGLHWQGNAGAGRDKSQSVPLHLLRAVLEVEGVNFICLQKGSGPEQLGMLDAHLRARIHTLGDEFETGSDALIDMAAIMANLDIVLTSDTTMAHLAGALGVPCWAMLSFMPDWRWLLNRADSPWYPSLQLFRQQSAGEWQQVVTAVAKALHGKASAG